MKTTRAVIVSVILMGCLAGFLWVAFVNGGLPFPDWFGRKGAARPTPHGAYFIVLGDNRTGHATYQAIVRSMTSYYRSAACAINLGDMITIAGNRSEWAYFLEMTAPLAAVLPWYGVPGNHDVNSRASQTMYQQVLKFPGNELYYSLDLLDSHFILLDTEIPGEAGGIWGEQLAWLKHDLQSEAARTARYTFVFTHQPPFPQGKYRGQNLRNAGELHDLFRQFGVDAVFSGDEHQYHLRVKDGIVYVVTGGAGAPLHHNAAGGAFHHYLLVELLPPDRFIIHVLDPQGREIQAKQFDIVEHNF